MKNLYDSKQWDELLQLANVVITKFPKFSKAYTGRDWLTWS